ncbi:hypothetical protein ABK040_012767 [Willaertia magna]
MTKHKQSTLLKPQRKIAKGVLTDKTVSHEGNLQAVLKKTCKYTTTNHLQVLRDWLVSNQALTSMRMKQLLTVYELLRTVDQTIGRDKQYLRKRNLTTLDMLISKLNTNTRSVKHYSTELLSSCKDWRKSLEEHYKTLKRIREVYRISISYSSNKEKIVLSVCNDWSDEFINVQDKRFIKKKTNEQLVGKIANPHKIPAIIVQQIPSFIELMTTDEEKQWWKSLLNSDSVGTSDVTVSNTAVSVNDEMIIVKLFVVDIFQSNNTQEQ